MCVRRVYTSLFWCTVFIGTFVPGAILANMGTSGWRWVVNDPTYSVWCLWLLPLAVSSFSCYFDANILAAALRHPRWGKFLYVCAALAILGIGVVVHEDVTDRRRPALPYYFAAPINHQLDVQHQEIARIYQGEPLSPDDRARVATLRQKYDEVALRGGDKTSVYYLLAAADCWNVGFAVLVIWYVIAHRVTVRGPLDLLNNRHLLFVAVILSLWFPFRVYSEWFIRFGSIRALTEYHTMIVCGVLLVVGVSVILASSMANRKPLFETVKWVGSALVATITAIVALNPALVGLLFGVLAQMPVGMKLILAMIVCAAAVAVFILIHDSTPAIADASEHVIGGSSESD
jgi:hypothetical protein